MNFEVDSALTILERTPGVLRAMLRGLGSEWTETNEGPDTWSPYDVVGHLIHGERTDWIARLNIIVDVGESGTFEPFDRFAQFEESKGKDLATLLDEFESLRSKNIALVRALDLSGANLSKRARHPVFGLVTLHELMSTWVVHDLDHIWQIVRTMAGRYRDDVGPWKAFLSLLHPRKKSDVSEVAQELVLMAQADQELRQELVETGALFDGYNADMRSLHHRNTQRLSEIVATYGWPRASLFGQEASDAAWLILQHSIDQPEFLETCLPLLQYAASIDEASPRLVAMTTDRLRVLQGQPQLYGTQFDWDEDGNLSPLPIEEEAHVEERRASVGLPTLEADTARVRAEAVRENEGPH